MFFFLLKKAFFDSWDHLGTVLLGNLSIFFSFALLYWPITKLIENGYSSGLFFFIPLIFILFAASGTVSSLISIIVDYRRTSWSDIPESIKKTWKNSIFLAIFITVTVFLSVLGIYYYSHYKNIAALAAAAFLFWTLFGVYLVLIWFFPVSNRLNGGFFKLIKKSFIILLDNPGLSLFIGLIIVPLELVLWPLTAMTLFGPAGIMVYTESALKLLLFKYDWLEENPGKQKKDIPWYDLLFDEQEKVGKRSLKGMIFPWKD